MRISDWSSDVCSSDLIARLHAASALLPAASWLPCRIEQLAAEPRFTVERVQDLLDDPRGDGLPARTRRAALLFRSITALAARNTALPPTRLHGDCPPNNIYLTADSPGSTHYQPLKPSTEHPHI